MAMELYELQVSTSNIHNKLNELGNSLQKETKQNRIEEIVKMMEDPSFWLDRHLSSSLIKEINNLKNILETFTKLINWSKTILDSIEELRKEYDLEIHELLESEYLDFKKEVDTFEIQLLLKEPYDSNNAILEFHPGAGGVDSQDWAEMLFRMYVRYAERNNFKLEVLDYQAGEEAGIKSVTILMKGLNAYGFLKGEKGVHRLVRISPFDSAKKRHTSFASVDVTPEYNDLDEVKINDDEIRIDTYRSSGAGGQYINKTDSAVRITHLPTGIVVSCQTQRSQIQNKEVCINMLKSKLYQKQIEEKEKELAKLKGENRLIEWGSQIRSYVFCPYLMVKDHRTNYSTSDLDGVMDGNIDAFIFEYLKENL